MYEEMQKQQIKVLENDNRLLSQEIEDYRERINKVIKYIKENFCNNNDLNSCWHEDVKNLLNILKGDE